MTEWSLVSLTTDIVWIKSRRNHGFRRANGCRRVFRSHVLVYLSNVIRVYPAVRTFGQD